MTIRLSTKLRNDMMGKEALITGPTIGVGDVTKFVDNGAAADSLTRTGGSWITDGFVAGDVLKCNPACLHPHCQTLF